MSTFVVQLNNVEQGLLDLNPATATAGAVTGQGLGNQFSVSKQRTAFVTGPGHTQRLLTDGETFTDCNYWKQFAYPQTTYEKAFIRVLTDDGSIWSENADENKYPQMTTLSAVGGSTFSDNEYDILGTLGGHATFAQIENDGSGAVQVRLNGLTGATFTLDAGATQVYNNNDLSITKIQVANATSGAATVDVNIQVAVKSVCNS